MRNINFLPMLLFLVSCAGTSKFTTLHVNDTNKIKNAGLIYTLPQTGFNINLEVTKNIFVAGSFHDYAEEFLGIENVGEKDTVFHTISSIGFETLLVPDTSHYYVVTSSKPNQFPEDFFTLTKSGFWLVNLPFMDRQEQGLEPEIPGYFSPQFTDLSIKRNLIEETDTLYKTILVDSAFVKVPLIKKQLAQKSVVKKAEEAANFIIRLRKRRFKLLAGMNETSPEGESMAVSVKELDELEKEYLSLFIGKTYTRTYSYNFPLFPFENQGSTSSFSMGCIGPGGFFKENKKDPGCEKITATLKDLGTKLPLKNKLLRNKNGKLVNILFYR